MSHFHTIPQDKAPELLNLIVEIPKGEANKYEYNKEYGILELDRVLHGPMFYPVSYCDVPNTWNSGDEDPLDAVVYSTYPIAAGTLVKGRVIGVMEMEDNGEVDHKVICVNNKDPRFAHMEDIADLPEWDKKDLQTFMETYKIPQTGPGTVKVGKFLPKADAYKLIEASMAAYTEKFEK